MRLLLYCAALVGEPPPAGRCRIHQAIAAPSAIRLRGLAARRASGERGGRAPNFEPPVGQDYIVVMKRWIATLLAASLAAAPAQAFAGAGNFTLVNKTSANIVALQIRRVGTTAWQPLGGNPAVGSRMAVAFSDPDCAFDVQARLADGKTAVFTGVNLCDVTVVTLNRGPGGDLWVDYD